QVKIDGLTPGLMYPLKIEAMDIAGNVGTYSDTFATENASVPAEKISKISQHGITWAFKDSVVSGQYCNGDYWVVGPVTIVAISPASVDFGGGLVKRGSIVNPPPRHSPWHG